MLTKHQIDVVAESLYRDDVVETPLVPLAPKSTDVAQQGRIFLKLENLQPFVRCYKLRGALAVMASPAIRQAAASGRRLVTASAGNFAQGLAHACRSHQVPLSVLVPRGASPMKLERIRAIDPEVRIVEVAPEAWWQALTQNSAAGLDVGTQEQQGAFVCPATHPDVVLGNATLAKEICGSRKLSRDEPLDIYVPYGGGGLACGVLEGLRAYGSTWRAPVRVLACELEAFAPLHHALRLGRPATIPRFSSFVDGIGATSVLPASFARIRDAISGSVLVSVEEVARACHHLLHQCGQVVEGAGAASLAAAWRHRQEGAQSVCVISGGNVALETLLQHCQAGLTRA